MILLNPQTYTVTRKTSAEGFDQATFEPLIPTETTFTIEGEVQPLSRIEREDLPEGYRKAGTLKLYTATRLRVVSQEDGLYSDIIDIPDLEGNDIAHEVFAEDDRSVSSGPLSALSHYRYTLLRVGAPEG